MSKYEPFSAEFSIKRRIFWYFIPTKHAILSLDNDPIELIDWMQQNIGECGKEWEWDWLIEYIDEKVGRILKISYYIKIRKRRSHLISLLLLRFKT